jgi:6-phosphofructokinase
MCSGDEAEEGEEFLDQEEEDRAATIALMGRATSDIAAAPASAVTPLQVSLCFVKQKSQPMSPIETELQMASSLSLV